MMKKKLAAILAAVLLGSMMVPGTVAFAQVNDPGTAVSTEAAEDTAASESTEEVTENASEKSDDASAADDENIWFCGSVCKLHLIFGNLTFMNHELILSRHNSGCCGYRTDISKKFRSLKGYKDCFPASH